MPSPRNLRVPLATGRTYVRAATREGKKVDRQVEIVTRSCYERAREGGKKRCRNGFGEATPDNPLIRRQQMKECLIPAGIGSNIGETVVALADGGSPCYGIDTLGERPRLMVTVNE